MKRKQKGVREGRNLYNPGIGRSKYNSFTALNTAIMEHHLKQQLWAYIIVCYPEVMADLKSDNSISTYLEEQVSKTAPLVARLVSEGKPLYVIEELCLTQMTAPLGPSRFNYIWNMLDNEFPEQYKLLKENGTRGHISLQLMAYCKADFDRLGFNMENAYDDDVYYEISGRIRQYLQEGHLASDAEETREV